MDTIQKVGNPKCNVALSKRFRIENVEVHYKGYTLHANAKNLHHPKYGLMIGTLEMF
jgi:hypothetical protein